MNQNTSGQNSAQEQVNDSETSLLDILVVLKRSYKLIVLFSILGIIASFCYLLIIPKQYQASAKIQMAQTAGANTNTNTNTNKNFVNIEEPPLLIARLSSPTSYNAEIVKACGLDSAKDAQAKLSKSVKLSIPKGVGNVIDLKIIGVSPKASIVCAQAVFDMIKSTQAQIIRPYTEELKVQILEDQERLTKLKDWLEKADKAGSAIGAAYLSTRDEIRFLSENIATLKFIVASSESRVTRLLVPIYASDNPVAPKKRNALLGGIFGGLFLGLLITFGRQLISKARTQLKYSSALK